MGAYYFDQTNQNILIIEPDSLVFGLDTSDLSMLVRYIGLDDFNWSLSQVPEWLQIIDSDSLGRSETADLTARVNRLLVDPGYTEDELSLIHI